MKYLLLLLVCGTLWAANPEYNASLATNVSLATDVQSSALEINNFNGYSITAKITAGASPVGVIKLQASNDLTASPTIWVDVADSSQAISADGNIMWVVADVYYKFVRVAWVSTSGSATLNVNYNIKSIK